MTKIEDLISRIEYLETLIACKNCTSIPSHTHPVVPGNPLFRNIYMNIIPRDETHADVDGEVFFYTNAYDELYEVYEVTVGIESGFIFNSLPYVTSYSTTIKGLGADIVTPSTQLLVDTYPVTPARSITALSKVYALHGSNDNFGLSITLHLRLK